VVNTVFLLYELALVCLNPVGNDTWRHGLACGVKHYISPQKIQYFVPYFAPQKQPNIVEHILCRANRYSGR
jgi:hypothetical protein